MGKKKIIFALAAAVLINFGTIAGVNAKPVDKTQDISITDTSKGITITPCIDPDPWH